MTLNEFSAWALSQGTVCKTNGEFCGECVSLINQYLSKVHGINAGAWGHAKDWANASNPIRQWFTPVNQSQPGDIGVSTAGQYGHIFIYTANGILEQNGRVPLRVTSSPDRNATVILRPKAGMPQAAQGGSMGVVDRDLNRIIHSEMEGWDLDRTHKGEYDALFAAAWGGRDLGEMVLEKWGKNGAWRNRRQAALNFYDKYQSTIGELSSRPTKAELEAANAKIAEEAKKVEAANKKAEEALKQAQEGNPEKVQQANLLEAFVQMIKKLWNK